MIMLAIVSFPRMITASFNRCRTKDSIEAVPIWLFINPFPHSVEHVSMDFYRFIAKGRVMESAKYVIHHFIN